MLIKKILVLATAAAISAPALADRGHRDYRHGYGHRVVVHKPHYYYRPAPRPVYVVHPAPAPQPVIVHQHRSNIGPALVFGAVLGAVIAGSVAASR